MGICQPGLQRCGGHEWGACEGAIGPREESCNGLDDNCDGLVDDEISLPPPCARLLGVCANARQRCLDGAWRACADPAYGPDFEPVEVSCDGLDNDCDGVVDSRPVVQLAAQVTGRWFFLSTAGGFALIDATELNWLDRSLQPVFRSQHSGEVLGAASSGDTLILAAASDAGVVLTRVERDGGSSSRTIGQWLAPDALELAGEVATARLNSQVQLLTGQGAPTLLGPDTDGTLRLSQTGGLLAWSGGLTRTSDLTLLRTGSVGPLAALIELGSNLIAGVPLAQPGQPRFLPDLLAGSPSRTLTALPVPPLTGIQATEHQGRVLLVGIETLNALWLVDERGTQRRSIDLESVRLTASGEPMTALAWEHAGAIYAVRRCAPR